MRLAVVLLTIALAMPIVTYATNAEANVLRVGATQTYHSIQAAVDAAQPGDTILIDVGTYQEAVTVGEGKEGITIAGVDRLGVVLDGANGFLGSGFTVTADGVTIRTMSAQDYAGNGFIFSGVDGFTMTDLVATDNGAYGLYAIDSINGEISYSWASGHGDSGFYIGETYHCDCDVHHNEGWGNMLGYSGTANSYVRLWENDFHHNRAGILMSVLPNEMGVNEDGNVQGTQVQSSIYRNYIHDNNCVCPTTGIFSTIHPPIGEGITIAGGWMNDVYENEIIENHYCGVCVFWLSTPPRGNTVHDNVIDGSRYGVWWDEWGEDNCFEDNAFTNVQVISDPDPLPTCAGPVGDLPCPDALTDWAACRASDARAPSAYKDAQLALRAYYDLQPNEDALP